MFCWNVGKTHKNFSRESIFFGENHCIVGDGSIHSTECRSRYLYMYKHTHTQFDQWSSIYGFVHERARTNIAVLGVVGDAQ